MHLCFCSIVFYFIDPNKAAICVIRTGRAPCLSRFMCPAFSENPFPVKSLTPLAVLLLNNCQLSFEGSTPFCSHRGLITHSLNKCKYITGLKKVGPSLFFRVYAVDMTKHNTLLMRTRAGEHARVCRLSQEVQNNTFTASIFQTTDGSLNFYM